MKKNRNEILLYNVKQGSQENISSGNYTCPMHPEVNSDKPDDPFIEGKNITGFTNSEEEAVQLTKVVPFLLEDELKRKGGIYSKKEDWASYVVTDGLLITGQNPASSKAAAEKLLELLKK